MILFYIIYPFFYLLGSLPYKWQRAISRFMYLILYRVVRYRVAVVRDNLLHAFPEKSDEQRLEIERKFYDHLSDVFFETFALSAISAKQMRRRMEFVNADQIERYTEGRGWIAAMAHYGTWEFTTSWGLHSKHDKVYAVYRPLHSRWVDKYYRITRGRFGVKPVAMDEVGREVIRRRQEGEAITIAMIADQSPDPASIQNWSRFFHRMTPFFVGMEKLALKFSMPIAFLHIDKFDNGTYKAWFEIIYDGHEKVENGEITRRYVEKLETMIRQRPELWMWSHKRWKHKCPFVEQE